MKEKSKKEEAILKTIMTENNFTPETSFFRFSSPKFLNESPEGLTFLSVNKNPTEMIIDIYRGGHSLMAKNVGKGLTFTTSVEDVYKSADKICVEVILKDILDQNGVIYEVTSVPGYVKAFFFSLPEEKIQVKICEI